MNKNNDEYQKYIVPFIKAILDPSLEETERLNAYTTKELVEIVNNFPDELILGLAMERPEQKGQYGFILNPRAFGILKSKERLAKVMKALLNRFSEAQKNKSDWQKYVCQLRKNSR